MTKGRKERSDPMAGIFTRSKGEIFLHRTRSGLARSDPSGGKRDLLILISAESTFDRSHRISIKDLRARRVFSPVSVPADFLPELTGKIEACVDLMDAIEPLKKEEIIDDALPGSESCSDEEQLQSTPPDLELLLGSEKADAKSEDQGVKVSNDDASSVIPRRLESVSINPSKKIRKIAPCSQLKVYRNPNSLAYRRLMPYFMDLLKDRSSGVEILSCKNYPVKVEKMNTEEKALMLIEDSLFKQEDPNPITYPAVKTNSEDLDGVANPSSEDPMIEPDEDIDDPTATPSPDSCSESTVEVDMIASEIPLKSIDFESEMMLMPSYSPPTNLVGLSAEEMAGNMPTLAVLQPMRNQSLTPKKGILKRQTRGCTGICMCLDCALFRVHAERAYEFSRKQMHEADEVMMGLMKELSCMRNIVEKSYIPDNAKNYVILQSNQEQVKRVCHKAFRVEELAKNRLKGMIHDLNTHCRITGPRVTFAECLEERFSMVQDEQYQ